MRELPLANYRFLVNHDTDGRVKDICFPNIGKENHSQRLSCPLIIKNGDEIEEFEDGSWIKELDYEGVSLVAKISGSKNDTNINITEIVHPEINVFIRKVETNKTLDLLWFLNLDINCHNFGNCVFYEKTANCLYYFKDEVWFLAGTATETPLTYQLGSKKILENFMSGHLTDATVVHGEVSALYGKSIQEDQPEYFYLIAGHSFEEVRDKNKEIRTKGFEALIDESRAHSQNILNSVKKDFLDLDQRLVRTYLESILILQTNINHNGAIAAACDSSTLEMNMDTYHYCWPRDGAYTANALDNAGFLDFSHNFFDFAAKHMAPIDKGWLWQKYSMDGSVGSTWHTFVNAETGNLQLPIQEDEVGILIWAFEKHRKFCSSEEEAKLYNTWIKKLADFLYDYRDDSDTKLQKRSYDLWEEAYGTFSYTAAVTYAGLKAASRLAFEFKDDDYKKYDDVAELIKLDVERKVYNEDLGRFFWRKNHDRLDASIFALWYFEMFDIKDPRIQKTMDQIEKHLWIEEGVGGICRYREDGYFRLQGQPANPWPICTLWMAYWHIMNQDKEKALKYINWVVDHLPASGVMPEQFDAISGKPTSVSPLTWSHATYIDVINRFITVFADKPTAAEMVKTIRGERVIDFSENNKKEEINPLT